MCINIIPTAPWSPWRNEEQHPPHRLQCGLGCRVVEDRTAHVPAQVNEDRGPFSRRTEACSSETSTAQYIIYNIKWGCLEPASSAKTPRQSCPGVPLPVPLPPKKKINNPPKNVSPSNLPSPVCPRDRSHRQVPVRESSASDPCKGFPPKNQ